MSTTNSWSVGIRDKHFLYLPVLYALSHEVGCFGLLPRESIVRVERVRPRTDREVLERVLDIRTDDNRNMLFGLCDPTILHDLQNTVAAEGACVLAALVTNAAFCAVDRGALQVKVVNDLGLYPKIIAYPEGTTSYNIAKRICKQHGRDPRTAIHVVEDGETLDVLPRTERGAAVALSPEVLDIERMISRSDQKFNVELVLGRTTEYHGVLVTTLVAHPTVVADHPEIVRGLLRAIQRALALTRRLDPDIIGFAANEFGYSADVVRRALEKSVATNLFPEAVAVDETEWQKAMLAHADPEDGRTDDEHKVEAMQLYHRCVTPYIAAAREAKRLECEPTATHYNSQSSSEVSAIAPRQRSRRDLVMMNASIGLVLGVIAFELALAHRIGAALYSLLVAVPAVIFYTKPHAAVYRHAPIQFAVVLGLIVVLAVPLVVPEAEAAMYATAIIGNIVGIIQLVVEQQKVNAS